LSDDVLPKPEVVTGKGVCGVGDERQILDTQGRTRLQPGRDKAERHSERDGAANGEPNLGDVLGDIGEERAGLLDLVDKDVDWSWKPGVLAMMKRDEASLEDGWLQNFVEEALEMRTKGQQYDTSILISFAHERKILVFLCAA
jgi:hypothetical protein